MTRTMSQTGMLGTRAPNVLSNEDAIGLTDPPRHCDRVAPCVSDIFPPPTTAKDDLGHGVNHRPRKSLANSRRYAPQRRLPCVF
jgi:hypothetical protein